MRKRPFTSAIAILALGIVLLPATDASAGGPVRQVKMQDNCDPATFNAAIGDGTCVLHGNGQTGVTFADFLAKLNPVAFGHADWNFKPAVFDLMSGGSIRAVVRGGELHTFTEVDAFGPGCLDFINGALGLTGTRPTDAECFGPGGIVETSGVEPGGSLIVSGLAPGTHLFECLIHPWMRSVVTVTA